MPATMRDAMLLRADVYRLQTTAPVAGDPDAHPVRQGRRVARSRRRFQTPQWFASHCYIVVVQDIRGQGASDGVFYEYANDRNDGYDTVEWAARLPGSSGAVGMYGSSYVGFTCVAGRHRRPHLR